MLGVLVRKFFGIVCFVIVVLFLDVGHRVPPSMLFSIP